MEGFLSLPRFAKGGIAVLLAVALLGWAIVAYSAKRQHDDVRSRDNAMATLKSQSDREQEVLAELETIKEQFATAETELAGNREALAAGREEKGALDARIAELEAEIAAAGEVMEAASGESQPLALAGPASDAEQPALVDGETLRARLTETMTTLSAKNATLQQRERELASVRADMEVASAEIETLQAAATERDDLRAKLTRNMTVLSARTATVQQKERELAKLKADHDEALAALASLEAERAEQEEAGRSLDMLTAKLAETQKQLDDGAGAVEQSQSELATEQARLQELNDEQAAIEAVIVEKQAEVDELEQKLAALAGDVSNEEDALAAKSSSLTAEFESLEAVLSEKEDAIAAAENELSRLEGEIAAAQDLILVKEEEAEEKQTLLNVQIAEIETAETSLAALKADQAEVEAETVELKSAINRQKTALDDLDALKGKLDETGEALARQTALLAERQSEIAAADTQLSEIRQASAIDPNAAQSLPTIPIAELSKDSLAVLPIDPLYVPFPVQTPKGVRLAQIHFDFASADLTLGGQRKAKEAAAWIKTQDVEKIQLVGFTDSIGTKENNKALAERRARSLLKLLEDEGVDGSMIEIVANGEEGVQEWTPDQTAEPLNRCVGIFISMGS